MGIVVLGAPAPAAAESVAGFTARLDQAIRQVEAAREHGAPLGDPGVFFPATEDLAWGHATTRVDHASLRAEWQAVPLAGDARREALERLRHRLAAVRAEVDLASAATRAGPPSPEGSDQTLAEILSRPEFKTRPAEEPVLSRLVRWLRERLGLEADEARRARRLLWDWVIRVLAGAAVLTVLIVLVRATLPLFAREPRSAQAPGPAAGGEPEGPEDLLALAEARIQAQDSRGAMQAIFRWTLLRLHRAGRLRYDPALTNREHLGRLKTDAARRAAFEALCRQFERTWYGLQPASPEEYAAFRAGCQALAGRGT